MGSSIEKKSLRKKTIISVSLFAIIFATLLGLASVYDLQVSEKLTQGTLLDGSYYAVGQFGLLFEIVGSFPIWICIAVLGAIVYHNAKNYKQLGIDFDAKLKKTTQEILQKIVELGSIAVVLFAFYFLFADTFKYILKYSYSYAWKDTASYMLTMLLMSVIVSPMFLIAWGRISVQNNKKLMLFALIIVVALITRIFIEGVKGPIGRVRYRAMNAMDDFSYYTPWYVINGKRALGESSANIPYWELSDACKSFPSGHTFAAGMSYCIICLPDFIKKWDNVVGRFLCWLVPIAYTAIVAVSRIMVGAHYFSDVLFGGTIVFLGVMLGREIFVCKFKHILCFTKSKEKLKS